MERLIALGPPTVRKASMLSGGATTFLIDAAPTASQHPVLALGRSAIDPFGFRHPCPQDQATPSLPGTTFSCPHPLACKRSSRGRGRLSAAPRRPRERARNVCWGRPRTSRRLQRRIVGGHDDAIGECHAIRYLPSRAIWGD